jgi:hypothetical protein
MKKKWFAFLAALGAMLFFWRKKKREEGPAMMGETAPPTASPADASSESPETSSQEM